MLQQPLKTLVVGTIILFATTPLSAAPEISVDSANFDMGIIQEGTQKSIKHSYKIKNTGNEKLIISKVKPGCGCTAVGHDSLILPGKEGTVTAEVNLTNFKPGTLRKYVTVYSNAKKSPELSLSLGCFIRSDLSIEPSYIRMVADKDGSVNQTFTVTSNKKDLAILEVSFKQDDKPGAATNTWQNDLPIILTHKFAKVDTTLPDGFFQYKLDVSSKIKDEYAAYGKFSFKTNYPGKEIISISGVVDPSK